VATVLKVNPCEHDMWPFIFAETHNYQGDHSPHNVKFPDGSQQSSAALSMLSVAHSGGGRNATTHDLKPYI